MYTSRRGTLVFYDRAPPLTPRSQLQLIFQQRWKQAAAAWRMLSDQQRADWETAIQRCNVTITGYNFFLYWYTRYDDAAVRTIERQSGITLLSE